MPSPSAKITEMQIHFVRPSRVWRDLSITFGVIALSLAVLFGDFIAAEWHAGDARGEVIDLAKKIPDNATREQVANWFAWGEYDYLKLRTHGTTDQWFFHTPQRLGATDWILVVSFDGGHAASVRVRTSDDLSRRPEGAPPDRTMTAR